VTHRRVSGWDGILGKDAYTQLHVLTVRYIDNAGYGDDPLRTLSIVPDPGSPYGEVIWYDTQFFNDPEFADGGTAYACNDGIEPNVIVSQMTTPAVVGLGEDISPATSVTVKNVGMGLTPSFTVRMVHSVDDTISTSDLPLVNGDSAPIFLDTGDSVTVTFPGLEIPYGTPWRAGYLGAIADMGHHLGFKRGG
jgi:hypothetical protein